MTRALVVGLGNPGKEYQNTRHNLGFLLLDRLAQRHRIAFLKEPKFRAEVARWTEKGTTIWYMKPQTYMNLSGEAVGNWVRYYQIPSEQVLIVADDKDLPIGEIRLRPNGGHGGHRGLENLIIELGTQQFPRLRIGIGAPENVPTADYVLGSLSQEELQVLDNSMAEAEALIEAWQVRGWEGANALRAQQCNRRNHRSVDGAHDIAPLPVEE